MLKGGSLSPDQIQGFLKKSYEKNPSSFNDFQIDKSLSGERVQVYYNPALRQAVVVHRGSAGAKDWLVNDAGLMVGYRGNRFSHAQDIQNKAEKKYGAKNVTTLGHSLGAKVAEEVGQNSKEIITLNKPTVDTKKVSNKQYDIRTTNDLVSGLSGIASSKNKTTISSGFRNPLTEHSTDVLSRLSKKKIGKGMKGGATDAEVVVTLRDFTNRYAQIRRIPSPTLRHERLFELLEEGSEITYQLTPEQAVPFNDLINGTYARELFRIGREIDRLRMIQRTEGNKENKQPPNRRGGRAINPRSIVPDLMTDEDRAEMARRRIEERRQAEMERMFRRIQLAPIQNPDEMPRRAIRPRNIGRPTGGGSCFSSGRIHPDVEPTMSIAYDEYLDAQRRANPLLPSDNEYQDVIFDETEYANMMGQRTEGGGVGDSKVGIAPADEVNELNNPMDELDNPLPVAEPTQKPIDTYRQIQALKIMEEKKLADLEENYFGWKESAEEEGYEDLPYNNSDADEDHMIAQMNQAQGMIDYYTQTEGNLRREMGITGEPSGGGMMCRCCRRRNCDCYTMSDFNELHSR